MALRIGKADYLIGGGNFLLVAGIIWGASTGFEMPHLIPATVLLALALILLLPGYRALQARVRQERGLCPNCSYDLCATTGTAKCPECGHRVGRAA